jgi:hypothetical protein
MQEGSFNIRNEYRHDHKGATRSDDRIQWLTGFFDDYSWFNRYRGYFPSPTTEATNLILETGFA